jgi:hypothetical protein
VVRPAPKVLPRPDRPSRSLLNLLQRFNGLLFNASVANGSAAARSEMGAAEGFCEDLARTLGSAFRVSSTGASLPSSSRRGAGHVAPVPTTRSSVGSERARP